MENAITVNHLVKQYKEHTAVNGISFEVGRGEFFSLLGENGAGKTTTINILCTILDKTAGRVNIYNHELGVDDDAIRNLIGIVFQNSVLDRELTVKENLFTRGSYYGLNRKQILQRIEPFMDGFELKEIWNRKYDRLSGGQRRRVDIVRALINQPKILFLDEPTTGLDPKSRRMIWDHIRKLREEQNLTIFLTTHYMEETAEADRVVILDKGQVIATGSPSELKSRYTSPTLVWYAEQNEARDRSQGPSVRVRLLDGCRWTYEADHYNVYYTDSVTDFLYRNRADIKDYEVIKGSMDDVFLNLTGREMAV